MSWTVERIESLKSHWAAGLSASQIAGELARESGASFTRNAILGKAHRLGLDGSKKAATSSKPRREPRPGRLRNPTRILAKINKADPGLAARFNQPEAIQIEQRKTLAQLTSRTCRWPIGHPSDADFYFCGAEEANNPVCPYCPYHQHVSQFGYPATAKKVA